MTCPAKQSDEKLSNIWEIKPKTNQSPRLNVGHVLPPLTNLLMMSNGSLSKGETCLTKQRRNKQQGITYIEIMIVVIILAAVAAVAMPTSSPTNARKLDIAAEEIAQAIRFARIESIRTASSYGVEFNSSTDTVKVYSLVDKIFFGFHIWTPTFNVYHPVDKKLYSLNIKTDSATSGVDLYSYSIHFGDSTSNRKKLGFNSNGIPKDSFGGTDSMLNGSATITLSFLEQTRLISVAPMTGRVTIQ